MNNFKNDICSSCQNGGFDKCSANFDHIILDPITRCVIDCDLYKKKEKHLLKITYECEGKTASIKKYVYDLPDVEWKELKPMLLGEFENVSLTEEQLAKLKEKYPHDYANGIESLSRYIAMYPAKGKKYKNHYAVICKWIDGDKKKQNERKEESLERESRKENKNKLQTKPSYDLETIKQRAMNNTEI